MALMLWLVFPGFSPFSLIGTIKYIQWVPMTRHNEESNVTRKIARQTPRRNLVIL